jgi:hypothetical protein
MCHLEEICRADLLEHALRQATRNGGAPGVDGQTIGSITGTPEQRQRWLKALQEKLQSKKRIGQARYGGFTFPRATAANGRWAYPR